MHVEILVEEPSAVAMLARLMPLLLQEGDTWHPVPHRGKDQLLIELPNRLKRYANRMLYEPELRVVLLMDADRDCRTAKRLLEQLVADAGLCSKTTTPAGEPFKVITRLAVSELEAWFLGDRDAIAAAYPRVHVHHFKGVSTPCDELPDAWETLHRILQKGGYYPGRYRKVEAAERIAAHLAPAQNHSPSFRCFCEGLAALR